ncbi:hypothetical protein PG991_014343 [Apiospora marii]|uniref:Fungal N-terminal domain-containing protein n=2 Tax=Apiospora marii TaxID=335849 RepID=A0ABR1R8G9_9PEZI
MAEIFGIAAAALGLLPLAVQVVKGFRTLQCFIKDARACTKGLEVLDLELQTQGVIFVNECELILGLVSSKSNEPRLMTGDPDHPLWFDERLENSIKHRMARSYEQCVKIMAAIHESQKELATGLEFFDLVRKERNKV